MAVIEDSFQILATQLEVAEANEKELATLREQLATTKKQLSALREQLDQANVKAQTQQRQMAEQDEAMHTLKASSDVLEQEQALLLLQLSQVQEELELVFEEKENEALKLAERQGQVETLQSSLEQKTQDALSARNDLEEVAQENALALLQLQQLQEELESVCLKLQATEADLAMLNESKVALGNTVKQLREELASAQDSEKGGEMKRKELEAQLSQVKQAKAEQDSRVDVLQQQLAQGVSQNIEQEQLVSAIQQQLEEAKQQVNEQEQVASTAQADTKELKSENELLVLQLQQIQEELEYLFQEYQALRERPATTGMTISQLSLLSQYEEGDYQELKWSAQGVRQPGRALESLHFKLAMHGDSPVLELRPENSDEQAALNWPEQMRDEYGDRLLVKPDHSAPGFMQVLASLSNLDWQLINGLLDAVIHALMSNTTNLPGREAVLSRRPWLTSASALQRSLNDLPSVVRFNQVSIKEVFRTPGYEHIWLTYSDLTYQQRCYDNYSFKLVFKDMKSDGSPATFALAFRDLDEGLAPLAAWPPNTQDDYGPLLNLEIDTELCILGQGWESLWQGDREFVDQLVETLPATLEQVYQDGKGFDCYMLDALTALLRASGQAMPETVDAPEPDTEDDTLVWDSVMLSENYRQGKYAHLGLQIQNLRFADHYWPEYGFKLFVRKLDDELSESWAGLEFRLRDERESPLLHWPPNHVDQDEYGEFVLADASFYEQGFHEDDQALVAQLIANLPIWLDSLGPDNGLLDPDLTTWQLLVSSLNEALESRE